MSDAAPAVWLARDFLAKLGRPLEVPPCDHSPEDCPPIPEGDARDDH